MTAQQRLSFEACASVEGAAGSRRAVARAPLPAGALVLREPATAAVLRRERWPLNCFGCWERLESGRPKLRCSRCRLAHFCGTLCQAAEWKRTHRTECGALPALARTAAAAETESGYGALAEDALLLGRLVRDRQRMHPTTVDALDSLCTSPTPRLEQARLVARAAADAGLLCAPTGSRLPSESPVDADGASLALAVRLASAFDANNFGVLAPSGGSVLGAASFPLAAVLNHACEPTCALAHVLARGAGGDGALVWQEIRTLVPLPGGAELTHSYIDHSLGVSRRRQLLRTGWGFECGCVRCAAADGGDAAEQALDGPIVSADGDEGAVAAALAQASATHAAAIACGEPREERRLLQAALAIRQRHLAAPHAHVRELHAALLACELADGNFEAARDHASSLVHSARVAFGRRPSASFAMLLLTAAELWAADSAAVDATGRVRALGTEAHAVLLITHGASHPLTRRAAAFAAHAQAS